MFPHRSFPRIALFALLCCIPFAGFAQELAGSVSQGGGIRISLTWNNRNDLDLHVVSPTGEEINFNNPQDSNGGVLDVDRNLYGETAAPMETVSWPGETAPRGMYRVYVRNYMAKEPDKLPTPFRVEITNGRGHMTFEGAVQGVGRTSDTEVCVFEFAGADSADQPAENQQPVLVDQPAQPTETQPPTFTEESSRTLPSRREGPFSRMTR